MSASSRPFLGHCAAALAGPSFIGRELLGGHVACAQARRRPAWLPRARISWIYPIDTQGVFA